MLSMQDIQMSKNNKQDFSLIASLGRSIEIVR